jgi:hypothetical protein
MERMTRNTKQPEDPFVIAECLARPVLTERLVADLSAYDKASALPCYEPKQPSANLASQR